MVSSAAARRRWAQRGMLALLLPNALSFELSLVRSRLTAQTCHSPSSLIMMKTEALPDSPADLEDGSCYLIDTDEGFVPHPLTQPASQCTHSALSGSAGASTSAPITLKSWLGSPVDTWARLLHRPTAYAASTGLLSHGIRVRHARDTCAQARHSTASPWHRRRGCWVSTP